jgi:hypothetical protein
LIPLDLVGIVIVELRHSAAEVLHLAHPKSVSWEFLFGYIARTLGVPLVPYSQWLARLEASESEEQAVKHNSALRLLGFYRSIDINAGSRDASFRRLVTDLAESASPALRDTLAIGEYDIQKWLGYWKSIGVITF